MVTVCKMHRPLLLVRGLSFNPEKMIITLFVRKGRFCGPFLLGIALPMFDFSLLSLRHSWGPPYESWAFCYMTVI